MGAEGEGVLFGPGLGAGDGERCRPGVDGEAGRCPTGDVNFLSFCNFTKKRTQVETVLMKPLSNRVIPRT